MDQEKAIELIGLGVSPRRLESYSRQGHLSRLAWRTCTDVDELRELAVRWGIREQTASTTLEAKNDHRD